MRKSDAALHSPRRPARSVDAAANGSALSAPCSKDPGSAPERRNDAIRSGSKACRACSSSHAEASRGARPPSRPEAALAISAPCSLNGLESGEADLERGQAGPPSNHEASPGARALRAFTPRDRAVSTDRLCRCQKYDGPASSPASPSQPSDPLTRARSRAAPQRAARRALRGRTASPISSSRSAFRTKATAVCDSIETTTSVATLWSGVWTLTPRGASL